jgi:hypothetical protein
MSQPTEKVWPTREWMVRCTVSFLRARCGVHSQRRLPTEAELLTVMRQVLGAPDITELEVRTLVTSLVGEGRVLRYDGGYISDRKIEVL